MQQGKCYCWQLIFHMNFSQLQERVRQELQRRIERGTLSVSLLARQTGVGQAHISNFLHARRQLSLGTLDKILKAQRLTVTDLLPSGREGGRGTWGQLLGEQRGEMMGIPLVSYEAAAFEPYISASKVQTVLPFPAVELRELRARCTASRRQWDRLVAVRVVAADALAMAPVLTEDGLAVIDRHYNSFAAYRPGGQNLYAVRNGARMMVRYADFLADRLVLRARDPALAPEVLELQPGETANELLVGRVALIVNGS